MDANNNFFIPIFFLLQHSCFCILSKSFFERLLAYFSALHLNFCLCVNKRVCCNLHAYVWIQTQMIVARKLEGGKLLDFQWFLFFLPVMQSCMIAKHATVSVFSLKKLQHQWSVLSSSAFSVFKLSSQIFSKELDSCYFCRFFCFSAGESWPLESITD